MNQKSTDNNIGKFSSFTKAKIFIVVLILIILLPSLVVGYKIFNYKKQDEMYNNAIEHSEGIVLGTKYFKLQKNIYNFSCYDTGVGIPQKVISTINNIESNREAFEWAMTDGNSTIAGVPRGLGLGLLKSFVQANDGRIRVCSGNILYEYSRKKGKNIIELNNQFYGTLFEMDIISDNDYEYVL